MVNLPWQDPFLGTWRGLATSCALEHPYLLVEGSAALGFQRHRWNAFSRTPWQRSSMGWQCHLALVEKPKCVAIGAPRPHLGPPYYAHRRPVCLWQSIAAWPPSERPSHVPPLLAPSSSSSSWGWGAGWVWLWEEEEEEGEDWQELGI